MGSGRKPGVYRHGGILGCAQSVIQFEGHDAESGACACTSGAQLYEEEREYLEKEKARKPRLEISKR